MAEEITVPSAEAAKTLGNFLKKRFPIGYMRKVFRKHGIRLNNKRPNPDDLIHPGDRIQLYIPFEEKAKNPDSQAVIQSKLEVRFEDDALLVINKPAGIAVHEGKRILRRHSVLGILQFRYRDRGIIPRLVHRLDKDTSGLLLVATQDKIARKLENLFQEGKVDKEYLCLVMGRPRQDDGRIDFPLPGREAKPVHAVTRFKVVRRFSETSLVRVKIETGRMHQIRLHFAQFGHPVVMDDQHGDFTFNKRFRKEYGLKRQFLHARTLTLEHHGKTRTWTAPLPDDLKRTLEALGRTARER